MSLFKTQGDHTESTFILHGVLDRPNLRPRDGKLTRQVYSQDDFTTACKRATHTSACSQRDDTLYSLVAAIIVYFRNTNSYNKQVAVRQKSDDSQQVHSFTATCLHE